MAVIFLNERRPLTKEQREMAEVMLNNEINGVMAELEIIEDELDRTCLFGELDLRTAAEDYLKRKLKRSPDGNVDEKVLRQVYGWYFPE